MTKKDVIKLVDELGELDRKLAAVAPLKKRAEAIKETLRGLMDACGPEEVGSFEGARYVAKISQRQLERRPIAALFDRLGKKRFLEIAKVSLKSIEALFKPHQIPH